MRDYKFNSLTPEVLSENKLVYTEALDYAFGNSYIKNIAITGIYGAGKSTVWNTYVQEKKLSNIINVSLGKYENDYNEYSARKNEESLEKKEDSDDNCAENRCNYDEQKTEEIDNDNRVERQLINQILSQIKSNKIPLSKYSFKSNKSKLYICFQTIAFISIICSLLIWIIRDSIIDFISDLYGGFSGLSLTFICAMLLFLPLSYYLYKFNKDNKFRVSKISFKGAEANVNDDNSDESVLDRDIKELVYLLRSSGTKIVVFEDLDRYNSTSIFTKLRELNFLLNHYVEINGDKHPVRFIYMLKDSLFFSKNRTKFFDFILPIVPIIDSNTSENELIELFKCVEYSPDKDVLSDISLYVDDMRLLKNIVNEYIVYSKIIPLGKIDLDSNKLFALLTIKNVFPNEFDQLQEDRGFIRTVFNELEGYKEKVIDNLNKKLERINDNFEFIKERVDNDKFKTMALMMQSDVAVYYQDNKTWAEFLRVWSKNPDENVNIRYYGGSSNFSYNEFVNRFILNTEEKKRIIENLPDDFSFEMNRLNDSRKRIKKEIKDIDIYTYSEIISKLTTEQRDQLFSIRGYDIVDSHYFPLIRYLIVDGLLDETYWYYKGNFNIDKSNILKRNDTIFVKGLKEGKLLDVFLDVETPNEIINRLKISDFNRFNILNKKVLECCLEQNRVENILAITDSVDEYENHKDLLKILDEFDLEKIIRYSTILVENHVDSLVNITEFCCENGHIETFKNILVSIVTNKNINSEKLVVFKEYIESNDNIISLIPYEFFEIFIENIRVSGIIFEEVSELSCQKERLVKIAEICAYKLNFKNLKFIADTILERTINNGRLLSEIYSSHQLLSSKEYIEHNFSGFITNYIDETRNERSYSNDEDILINILNSDISKEYKLNYVEKNEIVISNLSDLQSASINTNILDCLMRKNKIKFCSDNIREYWNMVEEYSDDFIGYLENNLYENNYEDVLSNNISICNTLINDSSVSDKVFEFIIKYANKSITDIDQALTKSRINILIQYELIEVTEKNLEILLNNSYFDELVLLVNYDEEKENQVVDILLEYELSRDLIYKLVNSEISEENSVRLIDTIKDSVLVENIKSDKKIIINYIIKDNLSSKNIRYICNSFNMFELKDEFIESLDEKGGLEELQNENLNKNIMEYILKSSNIKIRTKIIIIETKIKSKSEINIIKHYISLVGEIAELSNVWNRKQPLLDNVYKERIGQVLINSGYVKPRKDKDGLRIMVSKALINNTVETHLL